MAATRSLAQAGATRLALQRIDALQPATATTPPSKGTSSGAGWAEWERLRLQLLAAAGLHEQLLQWMANLPPGVGAPVAAELHAAAAQAALDLGRGVAARDHAGRALWAPGVDAARQRELRLLVIRSLARDRQADEAYRSMLRFQRDYRPLDSATATVFVDGPSPRTWERGIFCNAWGQWQDAPGLAAVYLDIAARASEELPLLLGRRGTGRGGINLRTPCNPKAL